MIQKTLGGIAFTLIAFIYMSPLAFSQKDKEGVCKVTIWGNDSMQFNKLKINGEKKKDTSVIKLPSKCKKLNLTLKYDGKLPRKIMGHNWLLAEKEDVQKIIKAAQKAGKSESFIPKPDSLSKGVELIAHTKELVGTKNPKTKLTETLDLSKLDKNKSYEFFCSFTGHYQNMHGKFVVQ